MQHSQGMYVATVPSPHSTLEGQLKMLTLSNGCVHFRQFVWWLHSGILYEYLLVLEHMEDVGVICSLSTKSLYTINGLPLKDQFVCEHKHKIYSYRFIRER